jgi:hypothetical protein
MENHSHNILRVRPDIAAAWSDREVAIRWLKLFPKRSRKRRVGTPSLEEDISALTANPELIEKLRTRLCSLSWFMGRLNEFIARVANKEDKVKGRFREGRFKCQALLDLAATACCMAYVDLNLIRAGLAATPEESDFTSIQERIRAWQAASAAQEVTQDVSTGSGDRLMPDDTAGTVPYDDWLCPISSDSKRRGILDMTAAEYFDLVDRTGRMARSDKRGAIDPDLAPILQRIGVKPEAWLDTVSRFGTKFHVAAGRLSSLRKFADHLGSRWIKGLAPARNAFT